ncbi:hypothetical protein AABB24_002987, partial [Solanum stoloniferum]
PFPSNPSQSNNCTGETQKRFQPSNVKQRHQHQRFQKGEPASSDKIPAVQGVQQDRARVFPSFLFWIVAKNLIKECLSKSVKEFDFLNFELGFICLILGPFPPIFESHSPFYIFRFVVHWEGRFFLVKIFGVKKYEDNLSRNISKTY